MNKFEYNIYYGESIKNTYMIKNKLSILLTLALTSIVCTGCEGLEEFLSAKEPEQTSQKQEQNEKENKTIEEDVSEEQQNPKVKSVRLQERDASLEVGNTYQIHFSVFPDDANQKVSFSSSKENICEVSNEGLVTACAAGGCVIRVASAEDSTKYADLNISVKEKTPVDPPVINYIVTFNANGGNGTMSSTQTTGSTYVAPSCDFVYENHIFRGWALNSSSGTKYGVGSIIQNISSDITLYATWIEDDIPVINYTVTFNANGGTGTMNPTQTNGSLYVTPACGFSYENHTFDGWALNSASGEKYQVGSTINDISSNITLFATWKETQVIPPDPNDYYALCEGLTGSALQAKLLAINAPESPSYDWSRYEAADEAEDDPDCILSIYTRHNIPKSNHCGSYSWTTWNREHIWTQTLYPKSKTDNHNIFACEGQINGYRSDLIFDEGGDTVTVFGHVTGCKMVKNTSFEPCDEAKGEVARSVMYGTVMYSYTMTNEIKSIELALKWHLEHPITSRETRRNDVVYGLQGNRNPFVDHPEYACRIWGTTNAATKSLCGGN